VRTTRIILHRSVFTCSSFDTTEFIGTPPEGSLGAKNESVVFFGVLTIASLEWLSERGLEYLQRDLRQHDESKHLEHNQSGLTLQTLYGDRAWKGSRLRVSIAGDKTLLAHFLTCEIGVLLCFEMGLNHRYAARNDPDKLIMYSVHEGKWVTNPLSFAND
jgi:hypothetical protein